MFSVSWKDAGFPIRQATDIVPIISLTLHASFVYFSISQNIENQRMLTGCIISSDPGITFYTDNLVMITENCLGPRMWKCI